jgi:hypothetical protein
MDIKKRDFLLAGAAIGAGMAATSAMAQQKPVNSGKQPSSVDRNYKPRRLNKCIELWEDGQPAYYTSAGVGPGWTPMNRASACARPGRTSSPMTWSMVLST